MLALHDARDLPALLASVAAPGPLPLRCVLVPRERMAHALRRELVRAGRRDLLAGTRFVDPLTAAGLVLDAAGRALTPGADALRPLRIAALFRAGLSLKSLPLDLVRAAPG